MARRAGQRNHERKDGSRRRGERGQILAISALLMTFLLGMIGLIIDGGFFYAQRRHAQSAADAASLAATYRLATGGTNAQATATALEYAAANGYDNNGTTNTVTVHIPPTSGTFAGQAEHVEVIIDEEPVTFFIHVLLDSSSGIQGRGVGGYEATSANAYALFANSNNCGNPDTLEVSGSVNIVNGAVHANANIKVSGSDNAFDGALTYNCTNGFQDGGQNNTYDPAPAQAGNRPFPIDYDYSDFPCTQTFIGDVNLASESSVWLGGNPNSNQLLPGVYCATGKLQLSGSNVTGTVTFAAQGIVNISGSNFNLTPYWNNILFFTSSNDPAAIDVSGSGGEWTGIMLAKNGHAKIQGSSNLSISGSVMANTIKISGSDFSLTAMEESTGGPNTVALKE